MVDQQYAKLCITAGYGGLEVQHTLNMQHPGGLEHWSWWKRINGTKMVAVLVAAGFSGGGGDAWMDNQSTKAVISIKWIWNVWSRWFNNGWFWWRRR